MGFFDLANPLLDTLDGWLSFASPGWRLVIWSAFASVASMGLYALFSRQETMAELKPQIAAARKEMANFDGELDEIWPLMRRQLGLSFRQLGLALGPALIASVPLIFLLVWLSNRFDTLPPEPGDRIEIAAEGGELTGESLETLSDGATRIVWPVSGRVVLSDSATREVVDVTTQSVTPIVHKRQWWNALLGNPAGYLPAETSLELVTLELRNREYLPFGPSWLRGWEASFLGLLLLFSLGLKWWWKLH